MTKDLQHFYSEIRQFSKQGKIYLYWRTGKELKREQENRGKPGIMKRIKG
jgi:hypothetical protein